MINVCHIIPTDYLNHLKYLSKRQFHLVLAHQVLKDKKYVKYYKNIKNAFIIMDNSAYELGEALDDNILLRVIKIMSPDEFVIPDVLYDMKKSIERYEKFMKIFKPIKNMSLMAVPQGKTLKEWTKCYCYFKDKPEINTLGIGQIYSSTTVFGNKIPSKFITGREYIIDHLIKNNLINKKKPHHLLGTSIVSTLNELRRLKKYSWIRSVDTAYAYLFTTKKHLFTKRAFIPLPTHINQLKQNIIHVRWKDVFDNIILHKYRTRFRYILNFYEKYDSKYKKELLSNIMHLNKASL
jgi:hypothetical protein